jgi:acetyl esterase/lipase
VKIVSSFRISPRELLPILLVFLVIAAGVLCAEPGKIIDAKRVEILDPADIDRLVSELFQGLTAPRARYKVDSYLLRFESNWLDGSTTPITTQVFIPRYTQRGKRPVYVFAPGTTGLIDACRPSREHIAGIHWGLYRSHVLAHAGQGAIGVLPDYMGFGDPAHLQAYCIAVAEGRMMLDAIRAIISFLEQSGGATVTDTAVFIAGFSNGGHAAFAAADLRCTYAPEVQIAGVIGYGPSTDMQALFKEFPVVAPMVVHTYSSIYGRDRFDPSRILLPRWAVGLAKDVTRQCIGGMQEYYPWSPRKMFRPDFADALLGNRLAEVFPQIHRILLENSTGLSGHRIPTLILQGTDDVVVSVRSQEAFVRELCRTKCPVQYILYKGSRHDTREIGFGEARRWMQRLTLGGKPESNCGDLL